MLTAVLRIDDADGGVGHCDLFKHHRFARSGGARIERPFELAIRHQPHGNRGTLQPHVEDAHLAGEERREFDIHREILDGHHRIAVDILADCDVGEGDGRERQKPRIGGSAHFDRLAKHAGGLLLEGRPVAGPVDEVGADKSGKERHNQQTAENDKQPGQADTSILTGYMLHRQTGTNKAVSMVSRT